MNNTRIEAWFMRGWNQTNFPEDTISMFLPKARRFRVTLHCRKDRYDVSMWNGRTLLMINPPIQKGFIGDDVEALFWGGGLQRKR